MPSDRVRGGGRWAGVAALGAWIGLLVAVLAGARRLAATEALAPPPLGGPGQLAAWASERDPLEATFALLTVALAAAAAALLVLTVLGVVARIVRAGRLVAVLDVFTVPLVRRLLQGALGIGLAGAAAAGPAVAGVAVVTPADATSASVPVDGPDLAREADGQAAWSTSASVPADRLGPAPEVDGPAPPTMELVEVPAAPAAPGEVTLAPGDHLWATATTALTTAWGRAPSDAEVAPYWDRLVAANRDRLPDPANPDLVLPGLSVVVPPAPPSP